jgi:hypothetical protein
MAFEENGERIEDLKMIAQKVRQAEAGAGRGDGQEGEGMQGTGIALRA